MSLAPLISSGTLTFLSFLVILGFIIIGSISLQRHVRHISPTLPRESELSEEGRAAQKFETRQP